MNQSSNIDIYLEKYMDNHEEFDPKKMDECIRSLELEENIGIILEVIEKSIKKYRSLDNLEFEKLLATLKSENI